MIKEIGEAVMVTLAQTRQDIMSLSALFASNHTRCCHFTQGSRCGDLAAGVIMFIWGSWRIAWTEQLRQTTSFGRCVGANKM
jgi:hypothetical protein